MSQILQNYKGDQSYKIGESLRKIRAISVYDNFKVPGSAVVSSYYNADLDVLSSSTPFLPFLCCEKDLFRSTALGKDDLRIRSAPNRPMGPRGLCRWYAIQEKGNLPD